MFLSGPHCGRRAGCGQAAKVVGWRLEMWGPALILSRSLRILTQGKVPDSLSLWCFNQPGGPEINEQGPFTAP